MKLFNKIFANRKSETYKKNKPLNVTDDINTIKGLSLTISSDENCEISISSSPVGISTGSESTDFYVYEWFIKDTGEIFYVGKGRGNRYKTFHERAYEAERIREIYDTDTRFVATGLTEEEAIVLESEEMIRILNETNYRLTNRIIPFFTKRDNGYGPSPNMPELQFETTPYLYASEIDEHYFGVKHQEFDEVREEELKAIVFITRNMRGEIEIIYGNNLNKYLEETKTLLTMNKSRILKSQFAKSVSAWIYIGNDYVVNYQSDQEKAIERIGRNIPTYHLLDVRDFLTKKYGEAKTPSNEEVFINPVHNRVPLNSIRNLHNWEKGYNEGMPYWERGDKQRKEGNLNTAIELFDKARYNGYEAPALYNSYAMAYRKLKDYDNEIAIIDEMIDRFGFGKEKKEDATFIKLKERREKALFLKKKQNTLQ